MLYKPIRVDFEGDYRRILLNDLTRWRYAIPTNATSCRELAVLYFNAKKRRIEQLPRRVHVASGLACPALRQPGYAALHQKAESGGDLNPHLSRQISDIEANDLALNDWDFHHLHLGVGPDPKHAGLELGTKELLFTIVRIDAIYFVAIGTHGDFACSRLVDIAYRNWPHLYTNSIHTTATASALTDSQRRQLRSQKKLPSGQRKAAFNAGTTSPEGHLILPLGGGFATTGRSLKATISADYLIAHLRNLERALFDLLPELEAELRKRGQGIADVNLRLVRSPIGWFAIDRQMSVTVQLSDNPDY
jgi:hypothetical protein